MLEPARESAGTVTFADFTQPNDSYILGLLQTDGSHSGSLEGKGTVSLELKRSDAKVLEDISAILDFHSSISSRRRNTNFSQEYESSTLKFFSQIARRRLAMAGLPVGRKSHLVGPPPMAIARQDYLRGILDGDGSVGFTRTGSPFVSVVTASPLLAEYVQGAIYEVTGVTRRSTPNMRDGVYNIVVTNQTAATLAAWVWYPDSTLSIPRKFERGQEVAQWTIPAGKSGRYGVKRIPWTPEQDEIVLTLTPSESAKILGRTLKSVSARRWRLNHNSGK